MKALVLNRYGSADDLSIDTVETPVPGPGEVRVRVEAASVNDWDWGLIRGKPFYIRLLCGLRRPKIRIAGVDVAGRIDAVGAGVHRFRPGDAVYGDLSDCGFGAFAEAVCVPESALALKPESLDYEAAAALPHAALLALQALRDLAQLRPGQTLLINGAGGGVGSLGVQIARELGAASIVGVDHAAKFDAMREAGFDRCIDYRDIDFTAQPETYDLILDAKTNRPPWRYSRVLRPNGVYVTVGGDSSRLLQVLLSAPLIRRMTAKRLMILALKPNRGLDDITAMANAGKILPRIDGPFELQRAIDAIQRFGRADHTGKVVISIGASRRSD